MTGALTDWDDVVIDDFGEIVGGGTPSRATPSFWTGTIPWVTPTEITALRGKYVRDTQEKITPDGLASSAARLLPVGSVVVTTRASLGMAAIAAVPLTTNQGFKSIIPNENTNSLFAYYRLQLLRPEMVRLASGTTFLEISKADFSRIRTRRPKPDEQSRIAAVLDTVDEAIAMTEAVIAKLRQVRAGLLHDLLTCGLDNHGQLRDPIAHPEQFQDSPLGQIPKEWSVEALESCCSHVIDCPHSTPNYLTVGVLVARTMHIRDGRYDAESSSRLTEEEFVERVARLRPAPGDVIFTREAPVGEAFVIPPGMRICLGQRVMLLRPKADKLTGGYLLAQVYSGAVRQRIDSLTGGTTNPHLNVAEVRKFTVPLPKVDEQECIAGRLSTHDVLMESEMAQIAKLKHLKSGLMTDLLTGRVRVPETIGTTP